MNNEPVILLAEDREDDIILIQRAFKKSGFAFPVKVVRDGEEAIRYLSGAEQYADRERYPIPSLFLLDLKMPLKDGFEVLRWIKQQSELKQLPVIVLTLSNRIRDVNQAYALGAYSFLIKSTDFEDAAAFSQSLAYYWSNFPTDGNPNLPPPCWPPKEDLGPWTGTPAYPQPDAILLPDPRPERAC
jgi:CheY-like chemotaxis protein